MRQAEEEAGRRLLDVLDVHYYSEAYSENNHRVSFDADVSPETQYTRVQSTRTLWELKYKENSWIGQWFKQFLPILPALHKSIDKYYPGTKLSITEYCFGAENHISGGIAQADALGIFAGNDVYLATLWSLTDKRDYAYSAINLYTNYDGKGGAFGDILVSSSTDNIEASSVYSSISSKNDGKLHIILINRDLNNANNFKIDIAGDVNYKSASVYIIDSSSSKIKTEERIKGIENNSLFYKMPPMSIAHLILINQDDEPEIEEIKEIETTETPAVPEKSENLSNSQESNADETIEKPDGGASNNVAVIIVICAIIVCAAAGIVIFIMKKNRTKG